MTTQQMEFTTPAPPRCAFCDNDNPERIYFMDAGFVCDHHIAKVVALAAEAVFPDCVTYSRNLEAVLM